jgi:predicted enzyme related to lactoylglutathione lyase
LPLDYAHFYVKAANGSAAAHYYEKLLDTKLSRWTIHEMKGITYEDEVRYGFCLDVSSLKNA